MAFDDLDLTDADRALATRLQAERPVPRAAFRGDLRRRLGTRHDPGSLPVLGWRWIALSSGSGLALLVAAGAGLAGAGPGAV